LQAQKEKAKNVNSKILRSVILNGM